MSDPAARRGPQCPSSRYPSSFINLLRVSQSRGQVPCGLSQGSPMSLRARHQLWSPVQPHIPPLAKGRGCREEAAPAAAGPGLGTGPGSWDPAR